MRNFEVRYTIISQHKEVIPANDSAEARKIVGYEYGANGDNVKIKSVMEIDDEQ